MLTSMLLAIKILKFTLQCKASNRTGFQTPMIGDDYNSLEYL